MVVCRIAAPHLTQRMMWAFPAAHWTIRGSWTSLLKVTLNCLESKQAKNIIFLPQSLALTRTRPLHCWEHIRLVRLAKKTEEWKFVFACLVRKVKRNKNSFMSWHQISHLLSFSGGLHILDIFSDERRELRSPGRVDGWTGK